MSGYIFNYLKLQMIHIQAKPLEIDMQPIAYYDASVNKALNREYKISKYC